MSRREEYKGQGTRDPRFAQEHEDGEASRGLLTPKTMAVFFIAGLSITLLCGVTVYLSTRGIERIPPTAIVTENFKALTAEPVAVEVSIEDSGSGLQAVNVTLRQGAQTSELINRTFSREPRFAEKVMLDAAKFNLKDGPAELIVQAWDDSAWNNHRIEIRPFVVDTKPPDLRLVFASESLVEGGTALAVYQAKDANLVKTGVQLGSGPVFEGTIASLVDPAFNDPDTYISIFTVPKGVAGKPKLMALDVADNLVEAALATVVERRGGGSNQRILVPQFAASQTIVNLFSSIAPTLKEVDPGRVQKLLASGRQGERSADIAMAQVLVTAGKADHFKQLRELLKVSVREQRRWRVPVPPARPPSEVRFGDRLTLADPNGELVSWPSEGEEYEVLSGADYVVAPFSGVARFAQNLGIYGTCLLLDHGVGVASFHYSLSSMFVDWGGNVELGQRIGLIGATGLHFSRQARFMILVHGFPVDPQDWMDPKRYNKVIEGALNGAKERLGLPINRTRVAL